VNIYEKSDILYLLPQSRENCLMGYAESQAFAALEVINLGFMHDRNGF